MIALASGANLVARAFSGNINETVSIIVEAIRHPGFSFVEVLSPCVTFRPDQKSLEESGASRAGRRATDDPARAARRLMTDDGFNLGVLYRGDRRPYQPSVGGATCDLTELEKEFEI